ncbi:MAG: YegP family protein [Hyphomicrobiales bacterium]|nr:YegP family protein [Hyphomicrobiales bacterium]
MRQKDGQFYFVLKAANGEIIARSEAYRGKSGCMNGIDSIKKNAIDAPVIDLSAA